MTAAEFVTAIRAITPNESEFSMMPEGFAQIYLGELHIGDKKGHRITEPNDAVRPAQVHSVKTNEKGGKR